MSKKEYIDSIDELKASEELKTSTIKKIKQRNKTSYAPKIILSLVNVTAIVLIVFSFANIINKQKDYVSKSSTGPIAEVSLEKLGSFQNLKNIAKNIQNVQRNTNVYYQESMSREESAKGMAVTDTATTNNDFSKTNIQVEGVDEADIVKTDGDYIYYISNSSKLIIVDAKDEKDLKLVKELELDKDINILELFINKDKLILLTSKMVVNKNNKVYYDYSKNYISALVYNISNKENINLVREVEIEGNYVSSRMIGEYVYFVSNKYIYNVEDSTDETVFLPKYRDTVASEQSKTIGYDCIYCFPNIQSTTYTIIAGFNINNNNEAKVETYLGFSGTVYCSENNLYLTGSKYEYTTFPVMRIFGGQIYNAETLIYKFNLDKEEIKLVAEGKVPGTIINQFSMDENNEYFRIATTKGENTDNRVNNVYILDKELKEVGKLENLAKSERIYSVRFMGNKCYMVTFKDVDPLFVIDLSNPTNPQVLGELKIPGYSKYLHPYDENHIIGFGEDTAIRNYGYGEVNITVGMKMALFDVSDVNNPKELYSVKIGDRGTYSEILYNHKALLFSKEKNLIAFPISITKNENVSNCYTNLIFQGAIVYGLDLNTGFTLRGKISHMENVNGYKDFDYQKQIDRILYIKDNLITTSPQMIKSINMNTMEQIDTVEFESKRIYGGYYLD